MMRLKLSAVAACLAGITGVSCVATSVCAAPYAAIETGVEMAPPTPPPVLRRAAIASETAPDLSAAALTLYSIGDPTDEEQLYLEYINRARANPVAEAQRLRDTTDPNVRGTYQFFQVDLALMTSQFATLPPVPPLSMNAKLLTAARLHSGDMLTNNFQGHVSSDGGQLDQRISNQGYTFSTLAENVYASAASVFHGHAGFEVDWGFGPGGMQDPPGHRESIHGAEFREVGIGVVLGLNTRVGPQLVTQDFGDSFNSKPFITGVAYYDLNANGVYDQGEGLGGARVDVSGSSFCAVTANSGGYSVPVPGNGTFQVSFSGTGLATNRQTVVVTNNRNVKVDFVPAYAPPVLTGLSTISIGQPNAFTFSPVGGATNYQWRVARRQPFTAVEGAEQGLSNVTVSVSPGYDVVATDIRASGSRSFHLAHPQTRDQFLTLNRRLRPSANSRLIFASRLGWAASGQIARAQVSTDDGATWSDVWSRPGTGNAGQTTFEIYTNSLSELVGKEIAVRFVYDHAGGYFPQTDPGVGWYLDDIRVTDAEELFNAQSSEVATNSFAFTPTEAGDYAINVRPRIGGRWLEWGPAWLGSAVAGRIEVQFRGPPKVSTNQVVMNFEVRNGTPAPLKVEAATNPAGPWSDSLATIQTNGTASSYRATVNSTGAAARFFRISIPQ